MADIYEEGTVCRVHSVPTNPAQKQFARLESDGVVVSQLIGKVRNYELNPRYPFLSMPKELLKAAVEVYPDEIKNGLLIQHARPCQAGKPLFAARVE